MSFLRRNPNGCLRFSTIGDLNTLVYQIREIKAQCERSEKGSILHMVPIGGESVENLRLRILPITRLLWRQSYINTILYTPPTGEHFNLDGAATLECDRPWLSVDYVRKVSKVVIHWKNKPQAKPAWKAWQEFYHKYHLDCIFLGSKIDRQIFRARTGIPKIQVICTQSYLDAARVIAGCDLFVGNSTVMSSIADGLGVASVVEKRGELIFPDDSLPGRPFGGVVFSGVDSFNPSALEDASFRET